jgi:hypothetical protein
MDLQKLKKATEIPKVFYIFHSVHYNSFFFIVKQKMHTIVLDSK